jgi:3-methyl-2-oxobutanoate hydroxymethyltransferase
VIHDLLGLYTDYVPKHAKRYRQLAGEIRAAVEEYAQEVRDGSFPSASHAARIDESVVQAAVEELGR